MAKTARSPFDARRLTAARTAAGLSKTRLAAAVGAHRQRIQEWESGAAAPHPRQVKALAAAVGVDAASLVRCATLRGRRYASGLTQAEAAARVGVDRSEWSRWEAGLPIPERYATAVRCALDPEPPNNDS